MVFCQVTGTPPAPRSRRLKEDAPSSPASSAQEVRFFLSFPCMVNAVAAPFLLPCAWQNINDILGLEFHRNHQ